MASIQVDEIDAQNDGQLFLCPVQSDIPAWLSMQDHIDEAKRRRASESAPSDAPVVIDLGPLTFFEQVGSLTPPPADAKEQMLRTVLGLGEESEVWCEFLVLPLMTVAHFLGVQSLVRTYRAKLPVLGTWWCLLTSSDSGGNCA